jgi:cytochrome c oxidase assembly protein subunit 15
VTALVVVVGGITRLTHSGLSIVEWKPIVGVVPPLSDRAWELAFEQYRAFPEYRQVRRGMTLGEFKFIFFWEYVHRLAARGVGVVFVVPFVFFWFRGVLTGPLLRRALVLFALGVSQGLLGWLMVKSGLVDRPSVSHYRLAGHLVLAFIICGYSVWLALDLAVEPPCPDRSEPAPRALGPVVAAVGVLLAAQVIYGAFVVGLKAGLLFNTFPLMDGGLTPPGLLAMQPAVLNFVQNPAAIQWMHRLLGTALLAAVIALFFAARRRRLDSRSRHLSAALTALVAAQYLIGVLTLIYAVPISLGVAHQVLALVVVGVWVVWLHHVGVRSRFSIQSRGLGRNQA